jgi:hypothetical protein
MTAHRRRLIDTVLDPAFTAGLEEATPGELRAKLRDARSEEDALSYVRRNLHGRLDMLRAELDLRKGGRGTTRSVEALTAALSGVAPRGGAVRAGRGGRAGLGLRASELAGRRGVEQVLAEDHLARLPELSDDEIADVVERVVDAEQKLSEDRHRLHDVIDALEAELADRYKDGLEPSLERLQ